uniref:GST N-terminal domain-containing protein n=1 Tax=Psilocybe cubensis TaxID=181762 RepID=A0A8H7XQ77_PSICU
MTIIFFDLPSTLPGNAWSPSTFKTRYTLNYKGIPYTTQWVEYPDVEAVSKKLGIKPTTTNPDGSDHYTLPAIYDPSTGVYLADSILIAEYLDKTYPDTPKIFPHNTVGLQHAFNEALETALDPLWEFILPDTCPILNPRSNVYFRRTREHAFGMTLEELRPSGERAVTRWEELKKNLEKVDAWYSKVDGTFILGNKISFADIVVASHLIWLRKVWGDRQEWKDIAEWNGGRWENLLNALEKYASIDVGEVQKHISAI